MIAAYMEVVVRDRASDRGCTGGSEGAGDVGPPGQIPGGFSFSRAWTQLRAARARGPPTCPLLTWERADRGYPHTATNEPHGPLARLRCDNAARGSRGNDADLEVLLGGRGGAHARPYRAQCPPFA